MQHRERWTHGTREVYRYQDKQRDRSSKTNGSDTYIKRQRETERRTEKERRRNPTTSVARIKFWLICMKSLSEVCLIYIWTCKHEERWSMRQWQNDHWGNTDMFYRTLIWESRFPILLSASTSLLPKLKIQHFKNSSQHNSYAMNVASWSIGLTCSLIRSVLYPMEGSAKALFVFSTPRVQLPVVPLSQLRREGLVFLWGHHLFFCALFLSLGLKLHYLIIPETTTGQWYHFS